MIVVRVHPSSCSSAGQLGSTILVTKSPAEKIPKSVPFSHPGSPPSLRCYPVATGRRRVGDSNERLPPRCCSRSASTSLPRNGRCSGTTRGSASTVPGCEKGNKVKGDDVLGNSLGKGSHNPFMNCSSVSQQVCAFMLLTLVVPSRRYHLDLFPGFQNSACVSARCCAILEVITFKLESCLREDSS